MSLQDRRNKLLPMVLVDLAHSNPKQPFDRLALFAEDGSPINLLDLAVGQPGPAGPSAYDVWKAQPGNSTKTVDDWLAVLKGAKGDLGNPLHPAGIWDASLDVKKGDVLSYFGSSYVAKNDVPPGGQSPAVDTVNYQVNAAGGGEIAAPATLEVNFSPTLTAATAFDIPGLSLVIPAGAPAYRVEADLPMVQFIFGPSAVAATQGTLRLFLVDENNVVRAQSIARVNAGAASAVQWMQARIRRPLPATASAKTIKLVGWLDTVTNISSVTIWSGDGTASPPSTAALGPSFIHALAR